MNRHYILNLDPQASHEWDRCIVRNPITGERPDFNQEIAQTVKNRPGSYLIKVNINVEILEQTETQTQPNMPAIIKPLQQTPERLLLMNNE